MRDDASARFDPPPALPASAALFLDFDGTLTPLVLRPQDVQLAAWVVPTLGRLQDTLGGAVAIVSGRPLLQIDALLHPLVMAAAGEHGAEIRHPAGLVERRHAELPFEALARANELAASYPGILVERKPSGLALHFRLNPECGPMCRELLAAVLSEAPDAPDTWELMNGHFVCELKQRAVSKEKAVHALMRDAVFAGKVPVFIGDDLTDEDGIGAVQAAGGFGIRVGDGPSLALHRLADTDAVADWLRVAAFGTQAFAVERSDA